MEFFKNNFFNQIKTNENFTFHKKSFNHEFLLLFG